MKYMGSKARHAKELLPIILKDRKPNQYYVEPFVGGCNMIDKVNGLRIGADLMKPLIEFTKKIQDGWLPPKEIAEETYKEIKNNKEKYPDYFLGYVGFQLSFGSLYFSTYRRDKSNKRNYSLEAYNNILKQAPNLKGIEFYNCSYDNLEIPDNSIIYCDPPYANTTKYATGEFDHAKFWQWCEKKHNQGHIVFVSEYVAPDNWRCVWEKKVNNTLTKDTGSKQGVERLFRL